MRTYHSRFDDNNKLVSSNDGATYQYDGNGNMTYTSGGMYGTKTMAYNDGNYMTSITYGSTTDSYGYSCDGRRYRASFAGGAYRYYLYDGVRVLEELDNNGAMQARYTTENGSYYGPLLHLYRPTGILSRFPMYDNIGTVRGLVDASGAVTDTYELDTFGRSVSSTGATPNPYRFGGAWGYITDPSGMLQLGVRYYWPELGRFVSEDPVRDGDNWYAYTANNPVTSIDPTGKIVPVICAAGWTIYKGVTTGLAIGNALAASYYSRACRRCIHQAETMQRQAKDRMDCGCYDKWLRAAKPGEEGKEVCAAAGERGAWALGAFLLRVAPCVLRCRPPWM